MQRGQLMKKLNLVTITGADDSTDIKHLVDLSAEFPFVEWAILVSKRQEGSYRFPSRDWIDDFVQEHGRANMATHICGRWVRDIYAGKLETIEELPNCVGPSRRIQLNTHGTLHETTGLCEALDKINRSRNIWYPKNPVITEVRKLFIFQMDGVNDKARAIAEEAGFEAQGLFDRSGGAGILPDSWPMAPDKPWAAYGYAGGLGPENVDEQIKAIEFAAAGPYWIDMERRVRTDDDSALDMAKVREVLEKMDRYMKGETIYLSV